MLDALSDLWAALVSLPDLKLYLTIGWAVYLVWLGGWILLEKREPAATLSWLVSLAALPYLGLVVYYLLGPKRIQRERLRRVRARARLPLEWIDSPAYDPAAIKREFMGSWWGNFLAERVLRRE